MSSFHQLESRLVKALSSFFGFTVDPYHYSANYLSWPEVLPGLHLSFWPTVIGHNEAIYLTVTHPVCHFQAFFKLFNTSPNKVLFICLSEPDCYSPFIRNPSLIPYPHNERNLQTSTLNQRMCESTDRNMAASY